ncbi:c6 transcription factor [Diplodia corticola]|uniref:C6 transcription factor n=1 Tax=Diplodia corticola TaxID=236234 RepID=A0A1J9RTC8_9PEZI|nr:c6 transcription factor [Diplodia corticola]OJD30781.1 c6 transcription factor [Diplodia corticola]
MSASMDEQSSVWPSSSAASTPRTRRRAITSCDTCRRRKVKCDRHHPVCSPCRTARRPCLYSESSVRQHGIAAPRHRNTAAVRRRLPRPDSSLDAIDTRLERLESLLERVIHASARPPAPRPRDQSQASASASHVSSRASPDLPSPAASSAEPIRAEDDGDGTLLVAKGGSQFVSSHHWSLLATELQDIREILSTDKEPSTPDVFAVPTGHVTQLLPADSSDCYELLRVFYLYVDPITRLVHRPSLDTRFALFVQQYVTPRWLTMNRSDDRLEEKLNHDGLLQFRPLAFAIFYAATYSQAAASGYAEDKRRLMATYRKGLELSLLAADFCSSSSLEVLQAYVLLLSCQLRDVTIGRTWPLLGVATRMAIGQGLHREPTLFRPVPDEVNVELRRRIWHQLCYLEWRAAELKGVVPAVTDDALTTRVPKNVNDSELSDQCHPGLLDCYMENEEGRWTDMTFLVGKSRWISCARSIASNVQRLFRGKKRPGAAAAAAAAAAIEDELAGQTMVEFERLLHDTSALLDGVRERIQSYFRFSYADSTPLQKLCLMTSRSMEWKCWLTFWCGVPKHFRKKVMTDDARRKVLHESVSLLENLNAITADPSVQGFKWFLDAHSAFQCIFLVLSELQELDHAHAPAAPLPTEDATLRARAVAALGQMVALHEGAESRPWAVIKKYVDRLEPAAASSSLSSSAAAIATVGAVETGIAGAGVGAAGGSAMDDVRRQLESGAFTTAHDGSQTAAANAAAAALATDVDNDFDAFTPVLPQPFATEEELLQFTFPPGTEWADPMQDFHLWHMP